MDLKVYNQINATFKEKYIYRFGGCTGFFSEYNHMLLTMAYCIIEKKQFVLTSEKANFAKEGWNSLFCSFCSEDNGWIPVNLNYRDKPIVRNKWERKLHKLYFKAHPDYHFMYEFVYDKIHSLDFKVEYSIPSILLDKRKASVFELMKMFDEMIWRYNTKTENRVKSFILDLNLPKNYAALHIRRGDKIIEHSLYSPRRYMEELNKYTTIKDVFVLTDDFSIIDYLKTHYSDFTFYTLCSPEDDGYDYYEFIKKTEYERFEAILRLITSVDIIAKSECFIGTYSTNPGVTLGLRMDGNKIHCLDYPNWLFW